MTTDYFVTLLQFLINLHSCRHDLDTCNDSNMEDPTDPVNTVAFNIIFPLFKTLVSLMMASHSRSVQPPTVIAWDVRENAYQLGCL